MSASQVVYRLALPTNIRYGGGHGHASTARAAVCKVCGERHGDLLRVAAVRVGVLGNQRNSVGKRQEHFGFLESYSPWHPLR
jgi:hypothetical protein